MPTITWRELGSPTSPGKKTVKGMTLEVEDRHIKAAKGEERATFRVIEAKPLSGPATYQLGTRLD